MIASIRWILEASNKFREVETKRQNMIRSRRPSLSVMKIYRHIMQLRMHLQLSQLPMWQRLTEMKMIRQSKEYIRSVSSRNQVLQNRRCNHRNHSSKYHLSPSRSHRFQSTRPEHGFIAVSKAANAEVRRWSMRIYLSPAKQMKNLSYHVQEIPVVTSATETNVSNSKNLMTLDSAIRIA